jgi:BirA family transcriptional regulator, biotin operon repressor / biotin---[acetyl-CoA-carboxylase] ligase
VTVDAQILRALRNAAADGAVSGADLADQLGISRAAIWARIQELRLLGYEIQASPHEGYRLRSVPDVLHADDLLSLLGPGMVIGRDIRVFQETTSTNDVVDKLGRDGVKEGVVVFAESQTKGRGRLGRNWVSARAKGLWFSVLLRPPLAPESATQITVASATAMARAIRNVSGLPAEIKWPNDILVNDRKICGILTEMTAELDKINYIVLGIGVNANFAPSDFPADLRKTATSLAIEAGRPFQRSEVALAILTELDRDYARVRSGQFEALADEWESSCTTIGRNVEIACGQRIVHGRAESLDPAGALLVRTQHGHLERIIGGDVTLRK